MSNDHQIFFSESPVIDGHITLDKEEGRHALKVMRLKSGDRALVIDGKGKAFFTVLEKKQRTAVFRVQEEEEEPKPPEKILCCAMIKKNAFEKIVEYCAQTEISEIIPVSCSRSPAGIMYSSSFMERLKVKSRAALKQSGGRWLTNISRPLELKKIPEECRNIKKRFIALQGRRETIQADEPALTLIGPEGGFTEDEIAFALENGFIESGLGNRRLRSEAAAFAAAIKMCV